MRLLIPLVVALAAACTAPMPDVTGRASVIDGDTLEIHGQRIRLWGVDAPEGRQSCTDAQGAAYACGRSAAQHLDRHLQNQVVACVRQDTDRYGRMVARCQADGEDVGAWLVRHGHAVRYARYAGGAYVREEADARREGLGLWAGDFTEPETWRREQGRGR